jgi:hypothetical protein
MTMTMLDRGRGHHHWWRRGRRLIDDLAFVTLAVTASISISISVDLRLRLRLRKDRRRCDGRVSMSVSVAVTVSMSRTCHHRCGPRSHDLPPMPIPVSMIRAPRDGLRCQCRVAHDGCVSAMTTISVDRPCVYRRSPVLACRHDRRLSRHPVASRKLTTSLSRTHDHRAAVRRIEKPLYLLRRRGNCRGLLRPAPVCAARGIR